MSRRVVESVRTGETFIFDDDWNDAEGRVRQLEYELKGHRQVPRHFHPKTAQSFEVLSGTLWVRVGRQRFVLRPGERIETQPGDVHAQWNDNAAPVRVIERYDPPLDIEPFFTLLPRAAASRNPLKRAVFRSDFRAISRGRGLWRRLSTLVLAPLGRLAGLSRWYLGPPR
jgi:quercetin dioxygenase-like cupin family protein